MRTGWLLASLGVSLLVVGCGGSSGGGTGGSGGHAGIGGHTGGSGGHTGGSGGGHAGSGGATGGAAGSSATGGGAGGSATGGHAGGGGASATGGTGGAAGGHAGTGGSAGAAGGRGGAGGTAGAGGLAGAAGGQSGAAGGSAGAGGAGELAMCGTDTRTSQGLECLSNTVDATGPCVTATISHDPTPTAGGGNIQQGTYDLVSITAYPADAGSAADVLSPVRKTVVLANGTANVLNINEADLSGSFLRRQSGTLSTTANTLTFTQTCPTPDGGTNQSGTAGYTFATGATPTLTVIENQVGHGAVVEVYQRRP